jgi:predicted transcriptional regulator
MDDPTSDPRLVELTARIVSAYVGRNHVPKSDLTRLIGDVFASISSAGEGASVSMPTPVAQRMATALEIRRSITPDYLVSFEDGKRYKTLRRSLALKGLTPEAYREKWGLPFDHPITAPNYSRHRSELAKSLGLGRVASSGPDAPQAQDDAPAVEDTPLSSIDGASAAIAPDPAIHPAENTPPPKKRTRKPRTADAGENEVG